MATCNLCTRQFKDKNALRQHKKSKHRLSVKQNRKPERDREESMAELLIEAIQNPDDPQFDWVKDMFLV